MILKKIWKHLCLITRHKWIVFKLCCELGQPWRGLVHDRLKKYKDIQKHGYIIKEETSIIQNTGLINLHHNLHQ